MCTVQSKLLLRAWVFRVVVEWRKRHRDLLRLAAPIVAAQSNLKSPSCPSLGLSPDLEPSPPGPAPPSSSSHNGPGTADPDSDHDARAEAHHDDDDATGTGTQAPSRARGQSPAGGRRAGTSAHRQHERAGPGRARGAGQGRRPVRAAQAQAGTPSGIGSGARGSADPSCDMGGPGANDADVFILDVLGLRSASEFSRTSAPLTQSHITKEQCLLVLTTALGREDTRDLVVDALQAAGPAHGPSGGSEWQELRVPIGIAALAEPVVPAAAVSPAGPLGGHDDPTTLHNYLAREPGSEPEPPSEEGVTVPWGLGELGSLSTGVLPPSSGCEPRAVTAETPLGREGTTLMDSESNSRAPGMPLTVNHPAPDSEDPEPGPEDPSSEHWHHAAAGAVLAAAASDLHSEDSEVGRLWQELMLDWDPLEICWDE
jgi:hypothetical protein